MMLVQPVDRQGQEDPRLTSNHRTSFNRCNCWNCYRSSDMIACCVAVFMRNKKQKESYNPSAGNQPLPYGQQPYDPRYPPYQQQYGQPYGQQQSGMNPMAAGALGVGAGLIGGAVLSNAFHHHHHHDHYGGYNNGYSGGNDFSGGGDFTSVDNF
ncbi:hypothetical protein EDD86DRAFT_102043 [Gorgonomyces haynaldii]|nr:hypothetical protein EDD86DRAFT_102043 [Gorgonomyces haynaldii]